MSYPLSKRTIQSLHLCGACHSSCGVQRGGSNLQAQSGVMAGAALVGRSNMEPPLVKVEPPKHVGLENDFPFHRSDGFGKSQKTHLPEKYIHWSWRWELVASNGHHISRIRPLSRLYRTWVGQCNWYCRIVLLTMITVYTELGCFYWHLPRTNTNFVSKYSLDGGIKESV